MTRTRELLPATTERIARAIACACERIAATAGRAARPDAAVRA